MTPKQQLENKVGKELTDKWIKMVQEGLKPETEEAVTTK